MHMRYALLFILTASVIYYSMCEQLTRMNAIVVQKEKQEAAAHNGGSGADEGHGH